MLDRFLKNAAATLIVAAAASLIPIVSAAAARGPAPQTIQLYTMKPFGFNQMRVDGPAHGKVMHTADGGSVFGFDVNWNGADGLLASAKTISRKGQVAASVETFDQTTFSITNTVIMTRTMDDFVVYGISMGDVGLVQHDHVVNNSDRRSWLTLNPVTGNQFNGKWTPPHAKNFLLQQVAENQTTGSSAVFATDFSGNPFVFGSNIAANTSGSVFKLDPNHFSLGDGPQLAQDTVNNAAVIATSPDGGSVGGQVPLIAIVDLTTGNSRQFNGVLIPPFNSGYVNGLGVDSASGVACTTTELDAQVEFYKLVDGTGFNVPLPGANGNQFNSGEAVVDDPVNHLFLVIQPNGSVGPQGKSVLYVFNPRGRLVKSITGFKAFGVTPQLQVNPNTRTAFVSGPTSDAITSFNY